MPPKTINEYFQPSSTGVHNNIDNLILQSKLDELAKTGSIGIDRTPKYIGGADDVVANVAMSPLMTLKSLGNVGRKIIEKTGLRNPVSHFTRGQSFKDILESGTIKGSPGSFPGRPFKKENEMFLYKSDVSPSPRSPAVSITRDPKFTSRPHQHVGADIQLVMDRDKMVKKGLKMEPYAETGYKKTEMPDSESGVEHYYRQLNPMFEFEERVRGNIPTENIELINALRFPMNESNFSPETLKLIKKLAKTDIPIIKSESFAKRLKDIEDTIEFQRKAKHPYHKELMENNPNILDYLQKVQRTPTYKFDPFKR